MSLMPAFSPHTSAYRFDNLAFVQADTTASSADAHVIHWHPDGSKLFAVRYSLSETGINVFTASTDWDISTLSSVSGISLTLDTTGTNISEYDFQFNDDGTKVFVLIVGPIAQEYIEEHALSAAYGGTATYTTKIATPTTDGESFIFADGGSKIIATDDARGFYEATLSTAYDLSTASAWSIKVLDLSGTFTDARLGLAWGKTEKQLIITADDVFHEYELSTAGDISSASYVRSYDPASNLRYPRHAIFGDAGRRFFAVGYFEGIAEWSSTA